MSEEESCIPWNKGRPETMGDLFLFYCKYVKPLYAEVQTENTMPQEVLFELNAALDHLSRYWAYNEPEDKAVHKAYGHMKRACLDIFKIRLKTAIGQLQTLQKTDISVIDNGEFQKSLYQLGANIKKNAKNARKTEGQLDSEDEIPGFKLWEEVWVDCINLEDKFYLNKHVSWARRHTWLNFFKQQWVGFVIGVAASIVATIVVSCFSKGG